MTLGAAAVAGVGASLALSACSPRTQQQELPVLSVAEDDVVTLEAFTEEEDPKKLYAVKNVATLGAGTMLFSSGGQRAAALCRAESSNPLSTIQLLNLQDGKMSPVLDQAVGHAQGFSLFDVTCSESTVLWVESNYLTSDWRVYSADLSSDGSIGKVVQLDEGGADYDVPEIGLVGDQAYWIVQPEENGPRTQEDSLLKTAGGSVSTTLLTSHGRFNGGLCASGSTITAMPRADASSGVYYQLTALRGGAIASTQILPRSFRPQSAIYIGNSFAFSIPASYDYGGGIKNVGTYYPLADGQWLRLTRQPVTPPGLCQGWLYCKSGARTVFVNMSARTYFTVDPPGNAASHGDYSVCLGDVDSINVYSTVSKTENNEKTTSVVVRRIDPVKIG